MLRVFLGRGAGGGVGRVAVVDVAAGEDGGALWLDFVWFCFSG